MNTEQKKKTLNELAHIFNDVSTHAPYLWAEVKVTVKIFINHPDLDEHGQVSQDCMVQIEAPGPSHLADDEDPILVGDLEKNITSLIINGIETATPTLSLDEVIEALNLDRDSPIWHLEYE